jgi:hypothetical protein
VFTTRLDDDRTVPLDWNVDGYWMFPSDDRGSVKER